MLHSTTNWLTKSSYVVGLTAQIIEQVSNSTKYMYVSSFRSICTFRLDHRFTDSRDLSKYLVCIDSLVSVIYARFLPSGEYTHIHITE